MANPLLEKFLTPFESIPFSIIKNEHYLPALKEAIALAKSRIETIKNSEESPSFDNVVVALSLADREVEIISSVFFGLKGAETNDEIQAIAQEFSPLLTSFSNDVMLDEKLFKKIQGLYDRKHELNLDIEGNTLLEKYFKNFVRNGALLNDEQKQKLRQIDEQLSKLGLEFSDHVLKETNKFTLEISDENDLEGLPDSFKTAAAERATKNNRPGLWHFTLHAPSYIPFITYIKNRELRKKMVIAAGQKAMHGDELDNREILKEIARLRFDRANLLSYSTHAEFVLEERMAQNSQTVEKFLSDLLEKAKPFAYKDVHELKEFAKNRDGILELMSWDAAYYSEKLKKEKFQIDDEMLRPYFKLENVVAGMFEVARRLYGLEFLKRNDIDTYHSEVETYEVRDENKNFLAIFYADYFPRAGKSPGAWMGGFRAQYQLDGVDVRPLVNIVCNFTRPTNDLPSLLSFSEVRTLFHEFGHALHGMLSKCKYRDHSGTSVYWDFVELPSQIMENWIYEKDCLDLFARHYKTGELIPADLVNKIQASMKFQEALMTLRQLTFGLLDMAWHGRNPVGITDVETFEAEVTSEARLLPRIAGTAVSPSFSHIFSGGYSAGYYSYKWAEVLDADAFEFFKEKGIFSKEVATRFADNILSRGGSEHPMTLYTRFRGKPPSVEALLRRAGLILAEKK